MKKKNYVLPKSSQITLTLQGIVATSGTDAYDVVKDEDAVQLSNKRQPSNGIWSHIRED